MTSAGGLALSTSHVNTAGSKLFSITSDPFDVSTPLTNSVTMDGIAVREKGEGNL